ncbi:MAG: acyl-CoA dehydrogenase [Ottowia sp.]|uniref:acyl-CoA dehydrogenase family protein n=1 Tax=Ottowia sp. TaxID=1898956 RepID=UPI003C794F15
MEIQTHEQRALHDSAARFLSQQCDFSRHRRQQQDTEAPFDRALWARFAEMGWLGVLVPESAGGLGYPVADALPIVEAMGAQFVTEPYQEVALASVQLLLALGDEVQQERWLPAIADGRGLTLLAHAEHGARYDLRCVSTRAERMGEGYRLNGAKCALPFGDAADRWLVSARTSSASGDVEGISLFVVEAGTAGLRFARHEGLCGEPWADMVLEGVAVPASARLGAEGGAFAAIEAAHELLIAAASMEAVGTLQAVLESTREYAGTRRQFGKPLSSFQVIAHRLVDMFTQVELTRSLAWMAADQFGPAREASPERRRLLLSACKAQVSAACRQVGEHAVQIHGGIGMTDELALSHQVRRLLGIERRLGDRFEHLGRLAEAVSAGQAIYA